MINEIEFFSEVCTTVHANCIYIHTHTYMYIRLVFQEADLGEAAADRRTWTRSMILASDKSMQAYTGLPNKNALTSVFEVIKK